MTAGFGNNHITVTTAANYIPELWLNEYIANFMANNVMRGLVTLYNHNKKAGDLLHIPGFTRSLAATKSASTQVTFNVNTHGVTTISLDKHAYYATMLEDIADIQMMSALHRRAVLEDAAYAVSREVDFQTMALTTAFNSGTLDSSPGTPDAPTLLYDAAVIGGDGSTAWSNLDAGNGTALSDAGIRRSIRRLDDQNYPLSNRSWVVPPITRESLLGVPRFTEQAFRGDGMAIKTGQIGDLYGDPVFFSTDAPTTTNLSGTTSFRGCVYFHKSALALAEQMRPRGQYEYELTWLGTAFVMDTIYGVKTLRSNGGIVLIVPAS